MLKTDKQLTAFNAYSLLLFGGGVTLDTMGRGLIVDNWLHLRGWARIGVLVSRLRMMLDDVLAAKVDNPAQEHDNNSDESRVIDLVRRLVEFNGMDQ